MRPVTDAGPAGRLVAYHNKAEIYGILFKTAAETLLRRDADPGHLGARIGLTAALHTRGPALTHHPHLHMIVPGGGISPDGELWVSCRPGFFGDLLHLADAQAFASLTRCAGNGLLIDNSLNYEGLRRMNPMEKGY